MVLADFQVVFFWQYVLAGNLRGRLGHFHSRNMAWFWSSLKVAHRFSLGFQVPQNPSKSTHVSRGIWVRSINAAAISRVLRMSSNALLTVPIGHHGVWRSQNTLWGPHLAPLYHYENCILVRHLSIVKPHSCVHAKRVLNLSHWFPTLKGGCIRSYQGSLYR